MKTDQFIAVIDPSREETALTAISASLESMTAPRAFRPAQKGHARVQELGNNEQLSDRLTFASDQHISEAASDGTLADMASLMAQMKTATEVLDTAKANLNCTKITAPIAGTVVSVSLIQGQTSNANRRNSDSIPPGKSRLLGQ